MLAPGREKELPASSPALYDRTVPSLHFFFRLLAGTTCSEMGYLGEALNPFYGIHLVGFAWCAKFFHDSALHPPLASRGGRDDLGPLTTNDV